MVFNFVNKTSFMVVVYLISFDIFAENVDFSNGDYVGKLKSYCIGYYDGQYHCNGVFDFPKGTNFKTEHDLTISATERIILRGNNELGNFDNRINLRVTGVIKDISLEVSNATIFGDIETNYDVKITDSFIVGDVRTNSGTVNVFNSLVNGNTFAHGSLIATLSNFCGSVNSQGSNIYIKQGESNFIKGNVNSLFNATVDGGHILGSVTSIGQDVTVSANVYSDRTAISAFSSVSFGSDPIICGDIKRNTGVLGGYRPYCGILESDCDYGNACKFEETIFNGCNSYDPPQDNHLSINASPLSSISLVCDENVKEISIDTLSNGNPESLYFYAIMSDSEIFKPTNYIEVEEDKYLMKTQQSGTTSIKLDIDINKIDIKQTYYVYVYLKDDPKKRLTIEFRVRPEAFRLSNGSDSIDVISGKIAPVDMALYSCEDGEIISRSYNETPTVVSKLLQPIEGLNDVSFDVYPFVEGNGTININANESGKFVVNITDEIKCSELASCPDSGTVQIEGKFEVNARPWALVICEDDKPLESGDSVSGNKFLPSGELFSLKVKPIGWSQGGSVLGEINSKEHCSNRVTTNFYLDKINAGKIILTGEQITPKLDDASNAKKLESNAPLIKYSYSDLDDDCSAYNGYCFNELYWREVGSIKIESSFGSHYLGMDINKSYLRLGRFYPAFFSLKNNDWIYDDEYGQFAYLGQEVGVSFEVVPLNVFGEMVKNYVYFSEKVRAFPRIFAVEECTYTNEDVCIGEELQHRDYFDYGSGGWNPESSSFLVNDATFKLYKKIKLIHQSGAVSTVPDGHFYDGFGLKIDNNVDGVEFEKSNLESRIGHGYDVISTGVKFYKQPLFYYGRLVLSNVGGPSTSDVNIFASVQRWNENKFEINVLDNSSKLNVDNVSYCKETLWSSHEYDSDSKLYIDDFKRYPVNGEYFGLLARPDKSNYREKVRFSILLDEQLKLDQCQVPNEIVHQEWLKYDWNDNGDESPESVVTFGIFRGNDKIIFRAEPGLYGL